MPRKTSLYAGETEGAILAARDSERTSKTRRHGRRSMIFREIIRRYDQICKGDVPDLTESEWNTLLPAGETWGQEDIDSDVRHGRLLAVARKNERLQKKLLSLRIGESVALIDLIERYWAATARGDTPPELPFQHAVAGARAGNRR
jgi:hypothetical protein